MEDYKDINEIDEKEYKKLRESGHLSVIKKIAYQEDSKYLEKDTFYWTMEFLRMSDEQFNEIKKKILESKDDKLANYILSLAVQRQINNLFFLG